ncbi:MAG: T9SS C-terminal target domain-containing protein [Chitinophagia bacterium]|nr:T9SS C-terminal target domain-containing protein [Chitinophagia bacterium]
MSYIWNDGYQASSRYINTSGSYWATGTDLNGCTGQSDTLTLTVLPQVQWVVQPQDSMVQVGNAVAFTAQIQGSNALYQWQLNRGNQWEILLDTGAVSGSNTINLALATVDSSWNGYRFRCIANLDGCSDTSEISTLTVEIPINGFGFSNELAWSILRNPSGLNLQIEGSESEVSFRIFDFSGRKLMHGRESGKGIIIDLSALPMGCYILELNSEKSRLTTRFCP